MELLRFGYDRATHSHYALYVVYCVLLRPGRVLRSQLHGHLHEAHAALRVVRLLTVEGDI